MIILLLLLVVAQISANQPIQDQCRFYAQLIDVDGTGPLCKYSINGCRICQNDLCLECLDGFYLNLGQCKNCKEVFGKSVDTCKLLNKLTIKQCSAGYYLDSINNQCIQCGEFCLQCTDAYSCLTCENDYFVYNYQCYSCQGNGIPNCCQQDTISTCKTCKPTFFLDSSQNCAQCIDNCLSCSAADTCDKCKKGYFYDYDNKQCIKNPPNCEQACQTNTKQLKCVNCVSDFKSKNMFYPDKLGQCQKCTIENCKVCSNQNQCQECLQGYSLMTYSKSGILYQQCFKCQTNCNKCQMNGSFKICYECTDGSQPVKGQCLQQIKLDWNTVQQQKTCLLETLNTILILIIIIATL